MANKLYITDTILRDAHQSQAATRMRIEEMLPACELLDSIGYWSLECWGGATFDACMRSLGAFEKAPQGFAKYKATDASQRTEHSRLQALCR